jgi:ABC-type phosphate/phosphonate transport system substrate-binding protein
MTPGELAMKMRVIAALAAALLLLLAAACGDDDDNASAANNANSSAESSNSDNDTNSSGNRRDDIAEFLEESGGMSAEQADCVAGAYVDAGISEKAIDAMLDGDFDVADAGQVALNLDGDDAVKLAEATTTSFECFDMSIPGG